MCANRFLLSPRLREQLLRRTTLRLSVCTITRHLLAAGYHSHRWGRCRRLTLVNRCRRRQGAVSIRKTVLLGMAIPMLKIRRPSGRLIFNMGIPIPGKTVFLIETGPSGRDVIVFGTSATSHTVSALTRQHSGPRLNKKDRLSRYGDSHVKDKTVGRTSYL